MPSEREASVRRDQFHHKNSRKQIHRNSNTSTNTSTDNRNKRDTYKQMDRQTDKTDRQTDMHRHAPVLKKCTVSPAATVAMDLSHEISKSITAPATCTFRTFSPLRTSHTRTKPSVDPVMTVLGSFPHLAFEITRDTFGVSSPGKTVIFVGGQSARPGVGGGYTRCVSYVQIVEGSVLAFLSIGIWSSSCPGQRVLGKSNELNRDDCHTALYLRYIVIMGPRGPAEDLQRQRQHH